MGRNRTKLRRNVDAAGGPSSAILNVPPAIAIDTSPLSAVSSNPPSDTSIAGASGGAPAARLAVANASGSIGPAPVTPKRR